MYNMCQLVAIRGVCGFQLVVSILQWGFKPYSPKSRFITQTAPPCRLFQDRPPITSRVAPGILAKHQRDQRHHKRDVLYERQGGGERPARERWCRRRDGGHGVRPGMGARKHRHKSPLQGALVGVSCLPFLHPPLLCTCFIHQLLHVLVRPPPGRQSQEDTAVLMRINEND